MRKIEESDLELEIEEEDLKNIKEGSVLKNSDGKKFYIHNIDLKSHAIAIYPFMGKRTIKNTQVVYFPRIIGWEYSPQTH